MTYIFSPAVTSKSLAITLFILAASPAFAAPRLKENTLGPEAVLRTFLKALADGDTEKAYVHVAPNTKKNGDAIATQVKVDYDSFVTEAKGQTASKFGKYKLGEQRAEGDGKVRIWLHFDSGDNDETVLIRENGRWYVADPIHIIR